MELSKIFEQYFIASNDANDENQTVCGECGGLCCRNMGCHISPNDLKEISVESIIALINESGCISIDWYEGNPADDNDYSPCYFLRMKHSGAPVVDPSWGGVCCLWTDSGCPLSFQYRPKGARTLHPDDNQECAADYTKEQCVIDWLPYRGILEEVVQYYRDKDGEHASKSIIDVFNAVTDFLYQHNLII